MEASDPLAGSGASAARALSAAAAAPAAIADDIGSSTGSALRKAFVRKCSLEALLGITFNDTAAPVADAVAAAAPSDNWTAIGLLSGLKLHAALGPLLMAERSESETELAYVKRLEEADVLRLLCGGSAESPLVTALAACVWQGLADLKGSKAASATELHGKFVQEGGAFTLSYGGLKTFYGGLERLVGAPNAKVLPEMHKEHVANADSDEPFRPDNYGIETTSRIEWSFVVEPTAEGVLSRLGIDAWPEEKASTVGSDDRRREPLSPSAFKDMRMAVDEKLAAGDTEPLDDAEFLAARLYTGPMFLKYNAVLRSRTQVPPLVAAREALTKGNDYVTTQHAVNSAIIKLGKLTRAEKVYRGVSGGLLPDSFWRPNEIGVRGGIEYAFMSTTRNRKVAMDYATQSQAAGTIFEIQMGMVDRGADLSWLSQYPHEQEVTFAPLTGLEVTGTRCEGAVLVVTVRLNVNLLALTLSQVVSKRRKVCVDMLDSMRLELDEELKGPKWAPSPGQYGWLAGMPERAQAALDHVRLRVAAREAEAFNDDDVLASQIKGIVAARRSISEWPDEIILESSRPMIAAARNALSTVQKKDLSELKSLANPPKAVKAVLEALLYFLRTEPITKGMDMWKESKEMVLVDWEKTRTALESMDLEHRPKYLDRAYQVIDNHPDLSVEEIAKASKPSASVWRVIRAYVAHMRLVDTLRPHKAAFDARREEARKADAAEQEETARLSSIAPQIAEARKGMKADEKDAKNPLLQVVDGAGGLAAFDAAIASILPSHVMA